ncbi:hypothetical protein LTR78_000563 [Recurvomyces mirabilis]|uniref:DUF1308 domain-containing protein n=1 Tax=Recurvomyces mirabilis TaxID=574656 RepID=A0AAE0WXD3_9PEZI|nr:hypothetical protein LTR78_000563 [Recurvomyces mirabilis]KAK5162217.1 hypothetical protein LTS14_000563 [Recurvomyces mirabilis]
MNTTNGEMVGNAGNAIADLVDRAKVLLAELQIFRDRLRHLRQEGNVELGHFRGTIQSELKMLERLLDKPHDVATIHVARSSNLPFLETLWSTVKKSRRVTSLQKRVYTTPGVKQASRSIPKANPSGTPTRGRGLKDSAVVVDAITDSGRTWTKVSLITNSRLLFDLAKQGWDSGGSDFDEDEDNEQLGSGLDDQDRDVPLVKTAKELCQAAKSFRVRTKHPVVHIVLPRVKYGETPEVDTMLDACKAAGATLYCGIDLTSPPEINIAIQTMAPDPLTSFSDVLNIDCTILLALVSEFSHAKVSKQPWFHTALRRQVEIEDNEKLLPSLLYPAMGRHRLVCTEEAASRMREIVDTIGTTSEKARTTIMLGDDKTLSRAALIEEMQAWSAYEVPAEWQLPIEVVQQDKNGCLSALPKQAHDVAKGMTSINTSVFLYGWAKQRTTITSNRTVVKQIETDLEAFEDLEDEAWPKLWLCPTARSLVGKEKRSAKKAESRDGGAWPLPDPLRREQQRRNGLDVLELREGHEVEDRRPNGYPCEDVLAAKAATLR